MISPLEAQVEQVQEKKKRQRRPKKTILEKLMSSDSVKEDKSKTGSVTFFNISLSFNGSMLY